jgi:hypothetical protein
VDSLAGNRERRRLAPAQVSQRQIALVGEMPEAAETGVVQRAAARLAIRVKDAYHFAAYFDGRDKKIRARGNILNLAGDQTAQPAVVGFVSN